MRIFLLAILFTLCMGLQAQDYYTYVTDKRFYDPTDLIGYNFVPSNMEIVDESERELDAGEVSFGITANNLYVGAENEDFKGVYNLNNINSTEYGFILNLMQARDPSKTGHLKIISNKYGHVEALIFKGSRKENEIIFQLPHLKKYLEEAESKYFTDRHELIIEDPDSLWGKTFFPFLKMSPEISMQDRLQRSDSTYISFVEEVIIEEKPIKKRRARKKKVKQKKKKKSKKRKERGKR